MGKILDINLTDGESYDLDIPRDLTKRFLGGLGFNIWYLYQNLGKGVNPLGPENILLFTCGLLTGLGSPCSSRVQVNAKSPLTSLIGSSSFGGKFGIKLRSNGFQSIIIHGAARDPVYILIEDGAAKIMDASSFWQLDTWETQEYLRNYLSDKTLETVTIGLAGVNLVPFACIVHDRSYVAGRTGMGAVMGAKNLKAIVVQGGKKHISKNSQNSFVMKDYMGTIMNSPRYKDVSTYGLAAFIESTNEGGYLTTRNHREVQFADADKIDGRSLQKYVVQLKGCPNCPVHCKADARIEHGKFVTEGCRPEYDSTIDLGSQCGLNDPEALIYLNTLCNRLGVDTISTGAAIAFSMELYDQKILQIEDFGGKALSWGNALAMEELIYEIVQRKDLGSILSQGVRQASLTIGKGAEKFAYHVKGLELPGIDPRGAMGTALGYSVSMRGADWATIFSSPELRWSSQKAEEELGNGQAANRFSIEGKGALIKRTMIVSAVFDSLGICKFPELTIVGEYNLEKEATLTEAFGGCTIDSKELLIVGERILNLQRLLNIVHGATYTDDRLPIKFLEEPASQGPAKGIKVMLKPMLKDFYRNMEWDSKGVPTARKLKLLGLSSV